MKFNNIIGNPPYQDINNKRSPLWQKFVIKSLGILKEYGYMTQVHPGNWRKPEHKLLDLFKSVNLTYLNINSAKDGLKTFGATTRYDWYLISKENYKGLTKIIDQDNIEYNLNISDMPFIPNGKINNIMKLITDNNSNSEVLFNRSNYGTDKNHMMKVDLLHNYTSYETRKENMLAVYKEEFKYPCVHAIRKKGIVYWYSNTNKKGHFGIPKVIFGRGNTKNPIIDADGKYGMTQDCFGIINNDLNKVADCFKKKEFQELINMMIWSGFAFDYRVIKYFKKDFWREFI